MTGRVRVYSLFADPAGLHRRDDHALLQLRQRQEPLGQGHHGVRRTDEEQRRGGDHAEGLRLAAVLAEVGKLTARQRRPVEGDGQHREAVAGLQELRAAGPGPRSRGSRSGRRTGRRPSRRCGAATVVAVVAGLAVDQIGGEGGGGALGDLVEEGVELHGALGGGGEAAGLVERHALQVEIQRDVLRGRVVDGGIPVLADVLAQPLRGEGLRSFGCGLGQGRLASERLARGGGGGSGAALRLGLTLVPEPAFLLAEVEAGGFRLQRKRERETQEGGQQGTHVGDGATGSSV